MIKINLLPSYIYEARRIKVTIAIFVALFIIEGGIVLGWQSGLQKQAAWYTQDQQRCETGKQTLDQYVADATAMKVKADKYNEWIDTFGTLQPFKDYNQKLAQSMIEAGAKLGGKRAWFTKISIKTDGSVEATGKIKGSMNFLSYYFSLKDEGFDLTPAVQPYNPGNKLSPAKQMAQEIAVEAKGKVTALPALPKLPGGAMDYGNIYQPYQATGGGAPTGGAPGTTPNMSGATPTNSAPPMPTPSTGR